MVIANPFLSCIFRKLKIAEKFHNIQHFLHFSNFSHFLHFPISHTWILIIVILRHIQLNQLEFTLLYYRAILVTSIVAKLCLVNLAWCIRSKVLVKSELTVCIDQEPDVSILVHHFYTPPLPTQNPETP